MHWCDKRTAMARLGAELERRGWTLFGWRDDKSDSMTDYYSPASWAGIATKGGATVAVDWAASKGLHPHCDSGLAIYEMLEHDHGPCGNCNGTGDDPSGWTLTTARANPREYNEYAAGPGCRSMFPDIVSPIPFGDSGALRCEVCHGAGRKVSHESVIVGNWPTVQITPKGRVWHVERSGKITGSGIGLKMALKPDTLARLADKIDAAAADQRPGRSPAKVDNVTVAENTERGGVEITFPAKPDLDTLQALKAAGWRWSRHGGCWYKKASDDARAFAAAVANGTGGGGS